MVSSLLFALLLAQAAPPAPETPDTKAAEAKSADAKPAEKRPEKEEPPVVTRHEIHVGGKALKYTVTTGLMPLKDAKGDIEAHIFFIAYTLDGVADTSRRPLMFSFNGGPGSASVWLHLGAIGPKRVMVLPDGRMPAPPFHLMDNEYTWLDQTDLVFIDPVGTGYSRAAKPELGKKFWSVHGC